MNEEDYKNEKLVFELIDAYAGLITSSALVGMIEDSHSILRKIKNLQKYINIDSEYYKKSNSTITNISIDFSIAANDSNALSLSLENALELLAIIEIDDTEENYLKRANIYNIIGGIEYRLGVDYYNSALDNLTTASNYLKRCKTVTFKYNKCLFTNHLYLSHIFKRLYDNQDKKEFIGKAIFHQKESIKFVKEIKRISPQNYSIILATSYNNLAQFELINSSFNDYFYCKIESINYYISFKEKDTDNTLYSNYQGLFNLIPRLENKLLLNSVPGQTVKLYIKNMESFFNSFKLSLSNNYLFNILIANFDMAKSLFAHHQGDTLALINTLKRIIIYFGEGKDKSEYQLRLVMNACYHLKANGYLHFTHNGKFYDLASICK